MVKPGLPSHTSVSRRHRSPSLPSTGDLRLLQTPVVQQSLPSPGPSCFPPVGTASQLSACRPVTAASLLPSRHRAASLLSGLPPCCRPAVGMIYGRHPETVPGTLLRHVLVVSGNIAGRDECQPAHPSRHVLVGLHIEEDWCKLLNIFFTSSSLNSSSLLH